MFVIVTGKVAKVPCNYGRSRQTIYSFSLHLFPNKINLITEMPCNQVSSADFPFSCHRSNQSEWMAKKWETCCRRKYYMCMAFWAVSSFRMNVAVTLRQTERPFCLSHYLALIILTIMRPYFGGKVNDMSQ